MLWPCVSCLQICSCICLCGGHGWVVGSALPFSYQPPLPLYALPSCLPLAMPLPLGCPCPLQCGTPVFLASSMLFRVCDYFPSLL